MKNLILLLLLAVSAVAVSQSTADLENSRWINGYYEVEPVGSMSWPVLQYTKKYCTTDSDTIIGSESYLQLFDCGTTPMTYHGGVRIENKQWFFISKDSTSEMLLYDFSLEVGDTLKESFYMENGAGFSSGFGSPVLNLIDTVIENGKTFRYFHFKDFSGRWIEGVGNSQGFLWHPYFNISGYQWSLECFSKNDTTYYVSSNYHTSNFNEACQLSFSLNESYNEGMSVYPNPSTGNFTLEIPHSLHDASMEVISSVGDILFRKELNAKNLHVNLPLPEGLYFIIVSTPNSKEALPLSVVR